MFRILCSLINGLVCNSSPLVIASGGPREMCVATLLSWPMSLGWDGICILRCNIQQKRRMCGRTAMMPRYLHGGWFSGDILHGMRCFNNVAQLHAPTGARLATATNMLQA